MAKLHDLAILPAAAPEAEGGGSPTQLMLLPSLPVVPHAPAGGSSTNTEICKQNTPPRPSASLDLNALGPTPQEASLWKAVDSLQAAKVDLELRLQTSEDRVVELEVALRSAASKAESLTYSTFRADSADRKSVV